MFERLLIDSLKGEREVRGKERERGREEGGGGGGNDLAFGWHWFHQ